ncbi:MAG: histidinol-phosphatase [Clostridia bacterium]|nr:histidinol-phosphatase [Clostridia bacterium]
MKANYHTHTFRCHHGYGCEWEYVDAAIAGGLEILGFADHSPWNFPPSYTTRVRMAPAHLPEYVETISRLKKQYAGKIAIYCGLEAEYYPDMFPEYLEMLRKAPGLDYLIMGQHYLENEFDSPMHCVKPTNDPARLIRYVDQVTEGLATGRFIYLAHPDVLQFVGDPAVYDAQMRRLCRNVNALQIPLEINLQGYRAGNHYPSRRFWEIAAEENCNAVVGMDAHRVKHICDAAELDFIKEFTAELGLKVLEEVTLKEDFLK